MNWLDKLCWLLLIIGGLDWGIMGFFNYNVIGKVFSTDFARIIYSVVGLAALYSLLRMLTMMSSAASNSGKK